MVVSYRLRDKFITLDEISDVLAIRPLAPNGSDLNTAIESVGIRYSPRAADEIIPIEEVRYFEAAGWIFLRLQGISTPLAIKRLIKLGMYVGRIYLNEDRHLLIGTTRLTVKLLDNLAPDDIELIFARYRLKMVRKLGFSSNLFTVEVENHHDIVELALNLAQQLEFIAAEPQLLEPMQTR